MANTDSCRFASIFFRDKPGVYEQTLNKSPFRELEGYVHPTVPFEPVGDRSPRFCTV